LSNVYFVICADRANYANFVKQISGGRFNPASQEFFYRLQVNPVLSANWNRTNGSDFNPQLNCTSGKTRDLGRPRRVDESPVSRDRWRSEVKPQQFLFTRMI
jgi:hypothetical protein